MTNEDRNIKLKYYITCLKCECSGKACEPDCDIQFKAGNFGEIIENLEAISEILAQRPCEDCISRKSAIDAMIKLEQDDIECYGCAIPEGFNSTPAIEALKSLPPVTPKEKTGKWIKDELGTTICSVCKKPRRDVRIGHTNYCNSCGVRMVSE